MAQTLKNGVQVFTNGDPYNLADDVAAAFNTANVVVRVNSQAERDALPNSAGAVVTRGDVTGRPLEIATGSGWLRQIAPLVYANTQTVGSGMSTNAFSTGTLRPIIQAGTYVGTTSANGDLTITYPTPFPSGVIGGVGFSGDAVYIVSATPTNIAMPTTSSLFLRFAQPGGAIAANTTVRGTWFAIGW